MSSSFEQTVREICASPVVVVGPDAHLGEIARTLDGHKISCVGVVDRGSLIGVVSTTDVLRADGGTAREVMRSPVITVDADTTVRSAAFKMLDARIHRVFVEDQGKPLGVLSTRDVMKVVASERVMTPISKVMTTSVVTVQLGSPILHAIEVLTDANVHGLAVLDGTRPIGVFTHAEAIHARKLPPVLREGPVENVISYECITIPQDTPAHRVASSMVAMNVRRILVTEGNTLRGVATGFDLMRVVASEDD